MAIKPVAPRCAEWIVNMTISEENCSITGKVEGDSNFNIATLGLLAGVVQSWVTATLANVQSDAVAYRSIVAYDLSAYDGPAVTVALSGTGAVLVGPVANNVAAVVAFYTGGRGRSARGRVFMPGSPVSGQADTRLWTSTHIAAVTGAFATLHSSLTVATYTPIVLSYYFGKALRTTPFPQPITSHVGDSRFGSRRKRLGKNVRP